MVARATDGARGLEEHEGRQGQGEGLRFGSGRLVSSLEASLLPGSFASSINPLAMVKSQFV